MPGSRQDRQRNFAELTLAVAGLLTVYFPLAVWLGSFPLRDQTIMHPPFQHLVDNSYISYHLLPYSKADNETAPQQSTLLLFEDSRLLGPAHSPHSEITTKGGGRYSLSRYGGADTPKSLIFSTSDNSDPNTNGKVYRILEPEPFDLYESARRR